MKLWNFEKNSWLVFGVQGIGMNYNFGAEDNYVIWWAFKGIYNVVISIIKSENYSYRIERMVLDHNPAGLLKNVQVAVLIFLFLKGIFF